MDQGDAAGEPGEEGGLLHRRVAAADHGDVLIAEEEAVTRGTRADAGADAFLLTGHAEVPGGSAHREDDRVGRIRLVADGDGLDGAFEGHLVHVLHPEVGTEPERLLAHLLH